MHTLVYAEFGDSIEQAIVREKQIKGGSRKKKLELIERINPQWRDLSVWFDSGLLRFARNDSLHTTGVFARPEPKQSMVTS